MSDRRSSNATSGRVTAVSSLLFVLLCSWWRLDYVPLLGVRALPTRGVVAALAGALWIDALLATILILGFVGAARLHRLPRFVGRVLVLLGFVWVGIARLADRAYYFYSGNHVDAIALEHLQGDAFGMHLDARVTAYLLVAGVLCAVGLACLVVASRCARPRLVLLHAVAIALGGQVAAWGIGRPDDGDVAAKLDELQAAPELQIPALALRFRASRAPRPEGLFLLDPVVKKKLRGFGILIDETRELPLVKDEVFEQPLPFAKTDRWVSKPNIIVLFFESFSAALTSVYSQRYPGLTPNLEDLASVSCVVDDFFNASTPTVTSLACCYGSYLPVTNTQTWYLKENNSGQTRLRCLPHILREGGWRTVHVHSLKNEFVRTGEAVARLGFDAVIDGPAIGVALGERRAHWGFSDHQIFRFVVAQLKAKKFESPFLLSVATVDSHAPFLPSVEGPRYREDSTPLLDSLHSADHAFGQFWQWFKQSGYYRNTIVVALADHAMFPGKEHAEVRPDEDLANRYYDRVMLCIHDPGHALPGRLRVVSSQLDLTPTLLHLLGINGRNHFDGHSIFGRRGRFPGLLGMHEFLFGMFQVVDGEPRLSNFRLEDVAGRCDGVPFDPTTTELSRCEYFHYYRWKRAVHVNNLVWR